MRAFCGKVLVVDLTSRTWQEREVPDEIYENYLSGVGLAAWLTCQEMPRGADPLGGENLLGFSAGILTGSGAMFSGRWLVTAKSPLTGGWGDANCGGTFGPAIKQCGYDGIFFKGIASEPVYLFADGERVEIRSAQHVWGRDATETEEVLQTEGGEGRKARVACIGPAGEKLSLLSGVCNDRGRLAARSGVGAVMGSKKLKAVVLAGKLPVQGADRKAMASISKSVTALIPKNGPPLPGWVLPLLARFLYGGKRASRLDGALSIPMFRRWGTTTGNQLCVVNGDAPVKNWAGSSKDQGSRGFNPDSMLKRSLKRYQCSACPLGCGAILRGVGGYAETHRPEYETSNSFGPLLLNDDLESVILLNEIVNRAGLDSISVGAVLAFAIECFENGLLTEEDTGGLRLTWGNSQAIVEMAKKIAARDGLGDTLADGVVVAAEKIGRGAEQFAVHAGGEELPMHDPKFDTGYGVHYISDPTPGRHTIGSNSTYETLRLWTKVKWAKEAPASYAVNERYEANAERGEWAAACSIAKMVIDGAGVCTFGLMLGVDRYPLFEYLNAAAGWQKTPEEYMEIGRRVQTLRQAFNVREGVMPKDVRMHGRAYGDPPLQSGATRGRKFDVYAARRFYWQALGWDGESGVPLPETLDQLGISIV